jgi:hypothetical protein
MHLRQNEFNALLIVIAVAFMCMGVVSVVGGVIDIVVGKSTPVICEVEVSKGHVFVGEGRIF